SAEALLVGPTRPPLQMVVNGRARASCGHLRTSIDGLLTAFLSNPRLERSGLAEQPVSRRRIAVRDIVHDVGLLQHAAGDLPALCGELRVNHHISNDSVPELWALLDRIGMTSPASSDFRSPRSTRVNASSIGPAPDGLPSQPHRQMPRYFALMWLLAARSSGV